ncbi:hypothetical protein [Nocardia sp. NPDC052566]|uniref:hypothetical protein n=1 Tax=Nocardia sp. NPDC052566 TaxID=3364330 RepID=UPI0037C991B2
MTNMRSYIKNHRAMVAIGASITAAFVAVGAVVPAIASADAPAQPGPVVTAVGWVTGDSGSTLTVLPTAGPQPLMLTGVNVTPTTAITFKDQPGVEMSSIIPGDKVDVVGYQMPGNSIQATSVNVAFQP